MGIFDDPRGDAPVKGVPVDVPESSFGSGEPILQPKAKQGMRHHGERKPSQRHPAEPGIKEALTTAQVAAIQREHNVRPVVVENRKIRRAGQSKRS